MTHPARARPFDTVPGAALFKRAAVVGATVTVCAVLTNIVQPRAVDFISYWAAAVLAASGAPAAVYDLEAHKAVQQTVVPADGYMPFPYPPPFLLAILPLGVLSYGAAFAVWVIGTLALYLAAARALPTRSWWLPLAFPPVISNAIIGQNGFLTGAVLVAGLSALPRRPFWAGCLLGCMVVKPQLALALPIALLAAREGRAVLGAACSSLALIGAALLAFGPAPFIGLIELAPMQALVLTEGAAGWHKMASVYAGIRLAGGGSTAAVTLHAAVAIAAAVMLWQVWRAGADPLTRAAALVCATTLISPYIYGYDLTILLIGYCWLFARQVDGRIVALLWASSALSLALLLAQSTVNIAPLTPLVMLALIHARRNEDGAASSEPRAATGALAA